jgi:hypothetical protein
MRLRTNYRSARRLAFTLIELLIVIGLITLVTTWVVFNQTAIGLNFTRLSPQEVFRLAVQEARYQAQINNEAVTLTWDEEAQLFSLFKGGQVLEIPENILPQERLALEDTLTLSFSPKLPAKRERSLSLNDSEDFGPAVPLKLAFSPYGIGSEGRISFRIGTELPTTLTLEAFSNQALPDVANR